MFKSDNIPQDMRFTYAENFDSYRDLNLIVGHFQKPIVPQMQASVEDVPGMYGNIYTGTDYGELTFNIPVTIMAYDETTYNLSLENIRSVLINNNVDRGKEYPIVFGDRPEVTYYVHLTNIATPTFLTASDWQAKTTLTFVASQPCGYLAQENTELYGGLPIYAKGNAPTHPVYTMKLNKDVTQLGFINVTAGGGYVATGYQVDADNTDDQGNKIENKEPLTTNEPATNLSFWDYGDKAKDLESSVNPDDLIDGEMGEYNDWGIGVATHQVQDKNRHEPSRMHTTLNFGNPAKHHADSGSNAGFYGPLAVHQDFNNPTYDWQLMINLRNVKNMKDFEGSRAMGHLDVYLLGENHERQGKIWIHNWKQGEMPRMGVQLGTKSTHVEMVSPHGTSGSIGPETIEGADHRRHEMWEDGKNQTATLYDVQYYKEAVANAKRKARPKSRRRRRRKRRILLGAGLSVQAYQHALNRFSLLNKRRSSGSANAIARRIKQSAMRARKVRKHKKKKGGRARAPKAANRRARNKYRNKVKKKWGPGSEMPKDYDWGAPGGTHWVDRHKWIGHKEIDFNNSDIFSDFDGNFFIRKVGKEFRMWIQVEDSKYGADPDPICEYHYSDDDGQFNFPLTSVAAHFTKHNITADESEYPHVYTQVHMGVGAVKYWSIIDGGNQDQQKPKIIAHKGEIVTIDTDKMKVYKSDGSNLTKITSFASTFPPLIGGVPNNVNFYPTPGTDCDVTCSYIPKIK